QIGGELMAIHILLDFRPAKALQIYSDGQVKINHSNVQYLDNKGSLVDFSSLVLRWSDHVTVYSSVFCEFPLTQRDEVLALKNDKVFIYFWVFLRVLRVHIGRSNGGVVKPSLLFECLAFALSVRVRRKPTTFFALRRKLGGTKRRNTNERHTHAERERPTNWPVQADLRGWIASYLNTEVGWMISNIILEFNLWTKFGRRSTEFVANKRSNESAADIEVQGVELPGLHGGVFSFFVRTNIAEKRRAPGLFSQFPRVEVRKLVVMPRALFGNSARKAIFHLGKNYLGYTVVYSLKILTHMGTYHNLGRAPGH
ncbi:hypothetical protein PROFUN_16942, partial [Planoprotostelium fungivorum]